MVEEIGVTSLGAGRSCQILVSSSLFLCLLMLSLSFCLFDLIRCQPPFINNPLCLLQSQSCDKIHYLFVCLFVYGSLTMTQSCLAGTGYLCEADFQCLMILLPQFSKYWVMGACEPVQSILSLNSFPWMAQKGHA